ncbi:hypothetical protein CF319_g7787 [Tilletia indica]|nr:hypothetical protein CF319_g7787 [Tilletia indica]
MTRVPAFLPEGWITLMKAAETKSVTLDMAITRNPKVHSIPPNEFGVDFADRRTCHLAGCDPEDVIPHSSSDARLFDLDASSEPFEEMVASIRNPQRLVRAFVERGAQSSLPAYRSDSKTLCM